MGRIYAHLRDYLIGKDADLYFDHIEYLMRPLTYWSDEERFTFRHILPFYYRHLAPISAWMSRWDFKFYMRYQDRRRAGTGSLFNPKRNIAGEFPLFRKMVDMQFETMMAAPRSPWIQ